MSDYHQIINRIASRTGCAETHTGECSGCGRCVELKQDAAQRIVDSGADRLGATIGLTGALKQEIARMIDHTILKPDASEEMIAKLCAEADKYGFASVCINPCWVKMCWDLVKNPEVKICGVAGFPLGANKSIVKAAEAGLMREDGADEIDMVINIGWAKAGKWDMVDRDIMQVVKAAEKGAVKVIIEACFLTDEEKIKACLCSVNAGARFVKTSTGFGKWGAKAGDVALMRRVVGNNVGVKAAGGIKTFADAVEMVNKGADRIGASAGVEIVG